MSTTKTITFKSGLYHLTGTLHLPTKPQPPVVIGCHGLLSNRDSPKQIALARACNQEGWAYFRFDHRGCGQSQGEFVKTTTLSSRCQDLSAAKATMRAHPAVGRLAALFGSSFGGTVVLAHAAEHPSPALITYAAPINSASIRHINILDKSGHPPASTLLTDALEFNIAPKLASAQPLRNILIAHGQSDETVPADHARKIHDLTGDPRKLILFKNGDHRMSDPAHQQQFEKLFINWIKGLN